MSPTNTPTACPPCEYCGNGIIEDGEECDNGLENHNLYGNCTTACRRPKCGDGILHLCSNDCPNCENCILDEECDDGNEQDGDGCSSSCHYECHILIES
jgi:hypothetical protein